LLGNMHYDNPNHAVQLGTRNAWGGSQPLLLSPADRRQHLYVIGKTGSGKTTLLRNLILQDIEAGEGVGLIDPHGDLAQDLLNHIPRWRTDDVVYFNPADQDYPIAFNLLKSVPPQSRHLVASGVVGAFKSIWRDSWGPRLEYVLYCCVSALLDCENASIMGIPRMLVDESYRDWVVRQCRDPVVRSFWEREFAGYDKRFLAEVISPVQNKLGQLLSAPPIRNILGQVKSKIDPRFMMDHRRILIANLSKGMLGADKSNLLGAILVTQVQLAAMARADVPEHQRSNFYLFLDEFHNFSTDSFVSMLSEIRKYGLAMTLANQYLDQTRPDVRDAVFGNVGSIISFRVGESDAATLAREFGGHLSPSLFSGLGNYEIVAKLLQEGVHTDAYLGRTQRLEGGGYGGSGNIIARSRQRYAQPRSSIEQKIERWLGT
jgi:hypothetical protein